MISNLDNGEILDFLMTSDFEGDYKPEELKYLLIKWRYFYRLLNGKYELIKTDSEFDLKKSKEEIAIKDQNINQILVENAELKNKINTLKNRELSWKERFTGKIIDKNED
jgi:hypothetical protein